jgi:hypothetical protein
MRAETLMAGKDRGCSYSSLPELDPSQASGALAPPLSFTVRSLFHSLTQGRRRPSAKTKEAPIEDMHRRLMMIYVARLIYVKVFLVMMA